MKKLGFLILVGFMAFASANEVKAASLPKGITIANLDIAGKSKEEVTKLIEDYVNKTLIGFGDVKLMMGIGGLLKYTGMENVMNFYIILYSFSGIVAFLFLFLKKWKKYEYIPFAPFIVISYVIFEIFFYKVF